jgi:hypothetical protein
MIWYIYAPYQRRNEAEQRLRARKTRLCTLKQTMTASNLTARSKGAEFGKKEAMNKKG